MKDSFITLVKIADAMRSMMRCAPGFAARYPAVIASFILVFMALSFAPDVASLPSNAASVYHAASSFGMFWLAVSVMWEVIWLQRSGVVSLMIRVLERIAMLWLGLIVIRILGEPLGVCLVWVGSHADVALAQAVGIILMWLLFRLAPSQMPARDRGGETLQYAHSNMRKRFPRSDSDIYRTAVHEAGHLFLYADLPELPAELTVSVAGELGVMDRYRGLVQQSGELAPEVMTEGYLRWMMLRNLAGAEAEFAILGERADGAGEDNDHWLHAALSYLRSGFGEVFYCKPEGEDQQAHNRAALNALKAQHIAELGRRFTLNKPLLAELAQVIAEKRSMSKDEIAPFLARVANPCETASRSGIL